MIFRTFKHYVTTKLGRMGAITALGTITMLALVACGTTDNRAQPTATIIQAEATATLAVTATVEPIQTATGEPPAAVSTSTEASDVDGDETAEVPDAIATETDDDEGMADGVMTATPSPAGSGMTTTPTAADQSAGTATEIKGTLREWAIDLSQQEVPAGMIRFVVTNEGQFTHNFKINGSSGTLAGTSNFAKAAGAQIVEVDLAPGTYTIICDLPGHAARGQKTELVVK